MIRQIDPVRRWKLSPTDLASLDKWDDYTDAKEAMFFYTDTAYAPWTVVKSNDKKRARINALRHVLHSLDYADKNTQRMGEVDPADRRPGGHGLRGGRAHPAPVPAALTGGPAGCPVRPIPVSGNRAA